MEIASVVLKYSTVIKYCASLNFLCVTFFYHKNTFILFLDFLCGWFTCKK